MFRGFGIDRRPGDRKLANGSQDFGCGHELARDGFSRAGVFELVAMPQRTATLMPDLQVFRTSLLSAAAVSFGLDLTIFKCGRYSADGGSSLL